MSIARIAKSAQASARNGALKHVAFLVLLLPVFGTSSFADSIGPLDLLRVKGPADPDFDDVLRRFDEINAKRKKQTALCKAGTCSEDETVRQRDEQYVIWGELGYSVDLQTLISNRHSPNRIKFLKSLAWANFSELYIATKEGQTDFDPGTSPYGGLGLKALGFEKAAQRARDYQNDPDFLQRYKLALRSRVPSGNAATSPASNAPSVSYGPWRYQSGISGGGNSGGYWVRDVIDANGFHTETSSTDPSKGAVTPLPASDSKPAKTTKKSTASKTEVSSLGLWSNATQELMDEGFFGPNYVLPEIRMTIPESVLDATRATGPVNMTGASGAPPGFSTISTQAQPAALRPPAPFVYVYKSPATNGGSTITGLNGAGSSGIKIDPTFLGGKYATQSKVPTTPQQSSLGSPGNAGSTISIARSNTATPPVKVNVSTTSSKITMTPAIRTPSAIVVAPSVRTPTVHVSTITVRTPTVHVPTVRTPTVSLPTVRAPTIRINVPTVRTPTISDMRLKRDIVELGELPNGLHLYRYRYIGDDVRYVGVMAQEVAKVDPDAVVEGADGFLRVDYGRLGLALTTWEQWTDYQSIGAVLPKVPNQTTVDELH